MDNQEPVKKKKRWTLRKELNARLEKLSTMEASDDAYKANMDGIEQATKIRQSKVKVIVEVIKDIGILVICGSVALIAYDADKNSLNIKNKVSLGLFNKLFHL